MADWAIHRAEAPEPPIHHSLLARLEQPRRGNLPLALTRFVGRTEALAAVHRLLSSTRLLTLSGPGGVGKTRLALEAASALAGQFEDGVWWVDLAPLCEVGLVAHSAVQALALPETPAHSEVAMLCDHLRDKHLLLVLDNCEHVIGECAALAQQLLSTCARLRILATSRESLGVAGEIVWPVPPLTVPCFDGTPALETLLQSESGQLFFERARAVRPDLPVTQAAVGAMAQVCCQLDGIPLAIELAAARVQVLSVAEIAAHLDDRFRLLTAGSRTALPRHQTLEAAIDWSYDLLPDLQQRLFRRLAVFAGTLALDGAVSVAGGLDGSRAISTVDAVGLLARLVAKSLLTRLEGPATRYQMLETLRRYGLERLLEAGELEAVRQRHLAHYLDLAERAESMLHGEEQITYLQLLEVEHDNLRAALLWSLEGECREDGLRLAAALAAFWLRVGYLAEGSKWLERALAASQESGPVHIRALYQAGRLAHHRGDYEQALNFARQSLALGQELGDARARARALGLMGWVTHARGDRESACALLEEGLSLARESGDERTVARTLLFLGDLSLHQGALEEATALLWEARQRYERMGDLWGMAWALSGLGQVARLQGDPQKAVTTLQLSLALYEDLDSKPEIPYLFEALALAAADEGQFRRAACLWGAASGLRSAIHARLQPSYEADHAPSLEKTRTALGEGAFAAAWTEGRAMTLAQALALAVEDAPAAEPADPASLLPAPEPPLLPKPRPSQYGLTSREVEVLGLVSTGLTDAQIAEKLVISPRTVGKHLQSIYSKLDLPSRSAATRWAIEHRLG